MFFIIKCEFIKKYYFINNLIKIIKYNVFSYQKSFGKIDLDKIYKLRLVEYIVL